MKPDEIRKLSEMLDLRDRHVRAIAEMDTTLDWDTDSRIKIDTVRPTKQRNPNDSGHQGYTVTYTLTKEERAQVLGLLKALYQARLTIILQELTQRGCNLDEGERPVTTS